MWGRSCRQTQPPPHRAEAKKELAAIDRRRRPKHRTTGTFAYVPIGSPMSAQRELLAKGLGMDIEG
jgi:hypothetical protein